MSDIINPEDMTEHEKIYTEGEAFDACFKYFDGDSLAADSCIKKYLMRDRDTNLLEFHPSQMHDRLASEFARIESNYVNPLTKERILQSILDFKYIIPGGSAMYGIGNQNIYSSIANCFYLGSPEDSYGGICQMDEKLVQIMKRRGGVGISLSSLRPKNSTVSNSAGTSTGAVSFVKRYSMTTKECAQNGRRGALMIDLDIRHPDSEEFIKLKQSNSEEFSGCNMSLKYTDDFLKAVENDEEYTLRWPVDVPVEEAKYTKVIKAKELWNTMVHSNWMCGDPGTLFWDTTTRSTISDCYADEGFASEGVNPCAEIILSLYGACILISLNLAAFVTNGEFNFALFADKVRETCRLADDMIDLEIEKVNRIIAKIEDDPEESKVKDNELQIWKNILDRYINGRRVGIGITGLADAMALCGIKYDTEEALVLAEKIFKLKNETEYDENAELARERGAFPIFSWEKEKDHPAIKMLPVSIQEKIEKYGRRSINNSTIAPTGTLSIMTRTTTGGEPLYDYEFMRRRKMMPSEEANGVEPNSLGEDGEKYIHYRIVHPAIQKWLTENEGKEISDSPWYGATAHDIDWRYRVKLQGLIQKYIGHSISSTINLPEDTDEETISQIYMTAWKEGCKGLTVFRNNCKRGILESNRTVNKKRAKVLECDIHYSTIQGNQWIFFVGLKNKQPYEIFGGKREVVEIPSKYKHGWIIKNHRLTEGRRTYDLCLGTLEKSDDRLLVRDIAASFAPELGTSTRMTSLSLRWDVPIEQICEQLNKDSENKELFCFEKGVSRVLKKYIIDGKKASGLCESCGSELIYQDGCAKCSVCMWSKCV